MLKQKIGIPKFRLMCWRTCYNPNRMTYLQDTARGVKYEDLVTKTLLFFGMLPKTDDEKKATMC